MNTIFIETMNEILFEDPHHPVYVILALQACGSVTKQCLGWDNYPNLDKWLFKTLTVQDAISAVKDTREVLGALHTPIFDPKDNGSREQALATIQNAVYIQAAVLNSFSRFGRWDMWLEFLDQDEWVPFCEALSSALDASQFRS